MQSNLFYLRVEISVSIKTATLPGFTVLQGLGQLCKFVSLWLVSISPQYADGCVCKIKICCYISVKLAQGRYKDFGFISALVSKIFPHLKSCSMPVSILGCIYMESITCAQISEKDLKSHVATHKIFSRLSLSAMPEPLHALTDGPRVGHKFLAFQSIPYGQTWNGMEILLLPHEGELWKTKFQCTNCLTCPSSHLT